jgi:hypothetical protein
VFPASIESVGIECPPKFSDGEVGAWFTGQQPDTGTVSGTEIVHRYLHEGPLIVCVYVHHHVDELVGEFGPFDPKPPPSPPPSPPAPPPSSPPVSPPATAPAPPPSAPLAPKPLTRAQKLTKALRECMMKPKRKRAGCEATARKLYGPKHKAKSHTHGATRGRQQA